MGLVYITCNLAAHAKEHIDVRANTHVVIDPTQHDEGMEARLKALKEIQEETKSVSHPGATQALLDTTFSIQKRQTLKDKKSISMHVPPDVKTLFSVKSELCDIANTHATAQYHLVGGQKPSVEVGSPIIESILDTHMSVVDNQSTNGKIETEFPMVDPSSEHVHPDLLLELRASSLVEAAMNEGHTYGHKLAALEKKKARVSADKLSSASKKTHRERFALYNTLVGADPHSHTYACHAVSDVVSVCGMIPRSYDYLFTPYDASKHCVPNRKGPTDHINLAICANDLHTAQRSLANMAAHRF